MPETEAEMSFVSSSGRELHKAVLGKDVDLEVRVKRGARTQLRPASCVALDGEEQLEMLQLTDQVSFLLMQCPGRMSNGARDVALRRCLLDGVVPPVPSPSPGFPLPERLLDLGAARAVLPGGMSRGLLPGECFFPFLLRCLFPSRVGRLLFGERRCCRRQRREGVYGGQL